MSRVNSNLNKYIKYNKYIRNTGMTASFLLFVMTLLVSFPIVPHTDYAEAVTPIASDTEISMVVGKGSADLALIPKDASGTFASSSNSDLAEFNVTTNNYTGYTLSIAGSDDNGLLTNADSTITTNNTLSSITSIIDSSTFNTTTYNNKWGYKPSKYNSVDNVSFHPAPTTTASTLDVTDSANSAAANTYTIGLGARVDYTKPAGNYTNTFILTAVGNPVSYMINYADTSGDSTVANLPTTQTGSIASTSVVLNPSSTPTRTGYTFSGWCDGVVTHVTDGNSTCNGTVYEAGTAYNFINQTSATNNATLYAMWNRASYLQTIQVRYENANGTWGSYSNYSACTTNVNYGSTHSCSIAASGAYQAASLSSYTVYGANTKQISVYRKTTIVTISNSNTTSGASSITTRYGGSATVTVTPFSGYYLSSVSCPSGYTCSGYSTGAGYTGQQTVIVTNNSTTSNGTLSFTGTLSCQSSISGTMQNFDPSKLCSGAPTSGTLTDSRSGNKSYTVAKIGSLWWMTKNLDLPGGTTLTSADSNVTSNYTLPASSNIGFSKGSTAYVYNSGRTDCSFPGCYSYYSYAAATAGTGASISSGVAPSDICPKGWRLPTQAEFNTLKSTYTTGATLTASPFLGVYGGYYYNSSFYDSELYGRYWSSTVDSDSSFAYLLRFSSSDAAVSRDYKRNGYSVRCVKS